MNNFVISGFLIGTILFKEFKKNNKIPLAIFRGFSSIFTKVLDRNLFLSYGALAFRFGLPGQGQPRVPEQQRRQTENLLEIIMIHFKRSRNNICNEKSFLFPKL